MTRGADISLPPKGRGLLHGDPRLYIRWENAVPVGLRLLVKDLPRRHRHYARANAFAEQVLVGLYREANFTPGGDDDYLRISAGGVCEHIGALRDTGCGRVLAAIESGQGLPRQRQCCRLMAQLQYAAICLEYFVGIPGTQGDQSRYRSQRCEVLDGLVCRTVRPIAHGVMGKDEESWQLHKRGQPNPGPRVVAENEKCGAEGRQLGERESVGNRGHRMLANAKMQILSSRTVGLKIARTCEGQEGLVQGPRSAEPPRNQGMFCARTFSTLLDASRPAIPFGSAGNTGRLRSHPVGSSRRSSRSISTARSGYSTRYASKSSVHLCRASAPRLPM